MVVVDLGGYHQETHMEEAIMRMARGAEVRAVGSEGGHGYGWNKRKHNFPEDAPQELGKGSLVNGRAKSQSRVGGSLAAGDCPDPTEEEALGQTEHIAKNVRKERRREEPSPTEDPIRDYDVPSDVEGIDGT
ncbi:hypothetical protein KC19_VG135300 [Ceratodon purpureus]|uniref:Uncharacterized protein n=1 Tax=Ceratodon purpureus TaxID=3225 RepID=A0A8T0HPV5_CERPU|nr:hypothetical protein KC19_VG135300 [Ceratodon purpureus]